MSSSLNTSVSGLLSHQRQLDMVANNLANMNTTGFKTQRIVFSDLIYELSSPATNGNGVTVGGTNPIQLGSGVKTAQVARNFAQGGFNATGQPLDFAIQGDGFFVLSNGTQDLYSRSGAFSLDASGILIDPATGFPVRRFGSVGETNLEGPSFQVPGDNRIRVPLGETILGEPTSNITFDGILAAEADGPQAQILTTANAYLEGGVPATAATLLNNLDTNLVPYQAGDAIEIDGTNADGSTFTVNFSVDGTTTLGDLVNAINAQLSGALVTIDASGNLVSTDDVVGPSMVSIALEDVIGNTGSTDLQFHSFVETTVGRDGDVLSGELDIFDVRGGERALLYEFQKVGINTWNLTFNLPPGQGTLTDNVITDIEFTDAGTLTGINNTLAEVTANFTGVLQSQSFSVRLDSLIQIAAPFSMSVDQDGLAPQKMVDVRVNSDGILQGITSGGKSFDLANIALASFRNPQGLVAVGNSYYESSLNSGSVELGAAGSGGRGTIRGGQLEGSNVDVAFEFTQLIVAQRGFSANARSITVADEVLEELTNIIR